MNSRHHAPINDAAVPAPTTPKRRPARNQPRGVERRSAIIAAAVRSFADHGYRGSSIADIAMECGISQAGLLYHFRSKAELLEAVLEYRDDMSSDETNWAERPGLDSLQALREIVRSNMKAPGLARLFTVVTGEAVNPEHPAHLWASERYRFLRKSISDALLHGIRTGEIRDTIVPQHIAEEVVAVMDGLQIQWLVGGEQSAMSDAFDRYIDSLIGRIAAPERSSTGPADALS